MIFERIKSEGLAHNSYFMGSGNAAAVIDPRRDIQVYLDLAHKYELTIKCVLETHRNEDYVIGSLELAEGTGATVYHGPGLEWKYGTVVKDEQEFRLGKLKVTAIYTPGHTNDSMSYVVADMASGDSPVMVFTGDTLFAGDTGRVDFYGKSETPHQAASLYDSIYKRLLPLGDGVILCPGHGAGSVCGQNIADRDESTLGIERILNPILQSPDKGRFIEQKVAENHEKPPYFQKMEKYNLEGPPPLSKLTYPVPMTAKEFKEALDNGCVAVDTSWPAAFGGAHIKGAYSIWVEGLPAFAGWILPYDRPLLLVPEDQSHVDRAVSYLRRIGYDQIKGFLKGGIEAWYNAGFQIESLPLLSVHQLKDKMEQESNLIVLDVRGEDEWKRGHIAGSRHIYTGHIEPRLSEIPRDKRVAVLCSVGHRAGLAASILLRAGFRDVYSVLGSITAWRQAGFGLTNE
jgi:hydroxyacylglutathione hydrolase